MTKIAFVLAAFLAAGSAAGQSTPRAADKAPERQEPKGPALNLRLEEGVGASPRITFGPPASATTKEEREKTLPELGGQPGKFDRPINPNSSGSPIPKPYDPYNSQ
ncbi:MAG TPA: hypothetical protein VM183_03585 [Burkholderiales bacterium]|nr:hypothetical protein [Burkholderiales bacterium]